MYTLSQSLSYHLLYMNNEIFTVANEECIKPLVWE